MHADIGCKDFPQTVPIRNVETQLRVRRTDEGVIDIRCDL